MNCKRCSMRSIARDKTISRIVRKTYMSVIAGDAFERSMRSMPAKAISTGE